MAPARSLLFGALLLLHTVMLAGVAAKKQRAGPRGFQAAKEAERQRAAAAAASGACAAGWCESGLPELPAGPAGLPACSSGLPSLPAALPAAQPAWPLLVLVAAAAFAFGLLAGVALQAALQRRRRKQQQWVPSQASQLEGEASCAASAPPAAAAVRLAGGQAPVERLQPADADVSAGGKQPVPQSDSVRATAVAAPAAVVEAPAVAERPVAEGSVETPEGGTASVAASAGPAPVRSAASDAAVAAAVQELVLQQSGSSTSAPGQPAEAASAAAIEEAAAEQLQVAYKPEQQQEPEQEAQLRQPRVPAAAGGGTAAGAQPGPAHSAAPPAGGALAMLQPEDASDVQSAAQLVLTMCRSMHIDPAQLSAGERLQLIYTMLQAWQAQQARRHAEDMSR